MESIDFQKVINNNKLSMGAQLCCQVVNIKEHTQPDGKKAALDIQFFFEQNPQVKNSFDENDSHEKYGFIDKTLFLQFPNGIYIGRRNGQERHGAGLMLFSSGMYYEGEWFHNQISGKGVFYFMNGDYYDGQWRNNLPQGNGKYHSKNPYWIYEGQWDKGRQNGKGLETFEDLSYYDGEFLNGKRHGKGKFRNPNGTFYEGEFENGQINGSAQTCDEQYIYEGQWQDGKQDGTGKSEWYDETKQKVEAVYIGEYKDGIKHGFGEYQIKGATFKGNWNKGKMTEKGVLLHKKQ